MSKDYKQIHICKFFSHLRYLLRPLGLEIEYTNIKGKSDHIYLTFSQPSERQKLYHKIILARQNLSQRNPDPDDHPLKSNGDNQRFVFTVKSQE